MLQEEHIDRFLPKMSFSLTDPELEENLNDIDEFIQSKLELACLGAEGPLKETEENAFNCFLPTRGILNGSPPWNKPRQDKIRLGIHFTRCL